MFLKKVLDDTSSMYSPVDMCTEIVTEVGLMAALDGLHNFKGNFLVCSSWIQDSSLKHVKTIHSLFTCRVTLVTLDCVCIWELPGSDLICIIDCLDRALSPPSDPFQFITHESYFHLTLYGLDY
jgi:hypothetical protein